jgi:hypothetical protein
MERIEPFPPSPGLWRLAAAAGFTGLTPHQLLRGCLAGVIPVSIIKLGERSHFVRADELKAWLATSRPAEENLFI